ncbi:MAG: FmdB family zinc ribbon protein [Gammaproteobacteria bacterium]
MPIYEYECGACEYRHEVIQKVGDKPLVKCPSCGKRRLKKLISAAGFRLSGSGWYETDFKKDNKKNVAQSDSKEPSKDKEKKDGKDKADAKAKPDKKESKKSESGSKASAA